MQTSRNLSQSRISRGEVFYVVPLGNEISEGQFTGGRPAIIVSNDMNNEFNGIVEIVYLTRKEHCKFDLPTNVLIRSTGLDSMALCNQIYTITKKRIGKYMCQCTDAEMQMIEIAMALSLCANDIFSSKKLVDAVLLWKSNVTAGKVSEEITAFEDFDAAEPLKAMTKPDVAEVAKHDVAEEKSIPAVVLPLAEQDITQHPLFIRTKAELDLLKQIYALCK